MRSSKFFFFEIIITTLVTLTFCSSVVADMNSVDSSAHEILFETWEDNSTIRWQCDYIPGDSHIDTSPVYKGKYAFKHISHNSGHYVHCFADHPLLIQPGNMVTDVVIEEYIYPSENFLWPNSDLKLWSMTCFEMWGAGYNQAQGRPKPHTWSPYAMVLSVDGHGRPFGQLTRADGLGGEGELWGNYWQNQGSPVALQTGQWNKIRFRFKLNAPGQNDGIFQLWVNDVLKCNYSTMNYRGTYTDYGWNHLIMNFHANPGHPQSQWISRDNIKIMSGEVDTTIEELHPPTGLKIIILAN